MLIGIYASDALEPHGRLAKVVAVANLALSHHSKKGPPCPYGHCRTFRICMETHGGTVIRRS